METFAKNKRANFDYEILETFEAGLALSGSEAKSIMAGRATIAGAHVVVRANEAFLVGADVPPYQAKNTSERYDASRTRKLLLNKKEISILAGSASGKGLTIIPLKLYNRGGRVKLLLGVARSKKKGDKREAVKKRETERELNRFRG